jgi:hypothetical protein
MHSRRIWAMMGVVYVLIAVLLMVYWMATMTLISGITGIMVFPAFAALSAQFFNRRWIIRHGRQGHVEEEDFVEPPYPQPGGRTELISGVVFAVLALFFLGWGVKQLIAFVA